MRRVVIQGKFPSGAPGFPVALPLVQASGLSPRAVRPQMMTSPWKKALAASLPYRPQAMANAVQPAMANVAVTRKPPVAPPVYRPEQQGIVQHKMLSATQAHTPPQIGIAQRRVAGAGVIQCDWFCEACNRYIRYSYDHQPFCRLYHHRTYETASDRAANYYDRPHGETRTRSGSFERQYSSGADERRHYHENLYGPGGYDESQKGYWDSNGRYHAY